MTRLEFEELIQEYLREEMVLLTNNGKEYTREDPDVLKNFKRIGRDLKLPMEAVWAVYFQKHADAIMNYCSNGGKVHSDEPIRKRIQDARNYLMLLAARVEELEREANL